jgi:hypothetical protein
LDRTTYAKETGEKGINPRSAFGVPLPRFITSSLHHFIASSLHHFTASPLQPAFGIWRLTFGV